MSDLTFTEHISYDYFDSSISAGLIEGHIHDSIYLHLKRAPDQDQITYMRPDEAATIIACLAGVLQSYYSGHSSPAKPKGSEPLPTNPEAYGGGVARAISIALQRRIKHSKGEM